jgi:hypothetical protein
MQFHSYLCAQCTPPVSSPRNETLLDFPARFLVCNVSVWPALQKGFSCIDECSSLP